jgi:biopolymer transport protein TolQ
MDISSIFVSVAEAAPSAKVGVKTGVLDAVLAANPFVQFLLALLVGLSVGSWAIMVAKRRQLSELRDANAKFNDLFWKAGSLEDVHEKVGDGKGSNLARVFKAAFLELQRIAESGLAGSKSKESDSAPRLSGLDNLERTIRKSIEAEVASAESRLNFLATVGSTSPFIGLLGTVVGIMSSFSNIANSGSASLAVDATGSSEALFSTAVGLFAALPAVAAYNLFVADVRRMEMDLNSFGSDFLNIAKRNFFKDA